MKSGAEPKPEPSLPACRSLLRWRRCSIVLAAAALPLIAWLSIFIGRQNEPVFEGRRIGEWFDDLRLNSSPAAVADPTRMARRTAALHAFARMDSNAIPYLMKFIQTPDSNLQTRLIHEVKAISFLAPVSERLSLPAASRVFAALALSQLGPKAEPAMPALIATYNKYPENSETVLRVIASIIGTPQFSFDYKSADRVLRRASRRYPHLFTPGSLSTNTLRLGPNPVSIF